jgi:thermostable 8-oxoguanine DNA glycosylase
MKMPNSKYKTLRDLLANELATEEHPGTAELIKTLRHVKRAKVLTKKELISICRWKSARALHLVESNHAATVRSLTGKALSTRSEQKRIEYLTKLRGVGLPMASAILMLIDPKRYGVIDIRVWRVLLGIGSVTKRPRGYCQMLWMTFFRAHPL